MGKRRESNVALRGVLHAADRVDVRIAVPEVGLDVGADLLPRLAAVVALRQKLQGKAAMPQLGVVRRPHGIKGRQVRLVVVHLRVLAQQQVLAPAGQGNVVVVDDGDDVGLHVLGPEQPETSPLNAVPADRRGERRIVFFLFGGRDVNAPFQAVVGRRFQIADHHQFPAFHGLELLHCLGRRIDRRRDYHFFHRLSSAASENGIISFCCGRVLEAVLRLAGLHKKDASLSFGYC